MNRYKVLLENERKILTSVNRLISEKKEKIMTYEESEPFIADMWNIHVKGGSIPKKYAERGLESLFNSVKPYAKSPLTVIGSKKYSCSDFWKDVTRKGVDTSKTDVKGDRNYSVKFGPAQLMGGVPTEARATFLVAAEKSGLAEDAQAAALELFSELKTHAFRTVGEPMNVKAIKNYKSREELKNKINQIAFDHIAMGEPLQKKLQENLQSLFDSNKKFQREFIYEAMTGSEKFSDASAIADTMLCINKDATSVKVESVVDSSSPYVEKVISLTSIRVDFKGSKNKEKTMWSFNTALRLQVKDLTEAKNECIAAINSYNGNILNESFMDYIKEAWKKLKGVIDKIKQFIVKAVEYIKKGFQKLLEFFEIDFDVQGWQKLDTIDLYDVA